MAMPADDVLAAVKTRLQIAGADFDQLIMSYVAEIGQRIKHYCNVSDIPAELEPTWAAMVVDALRVDQAHIPAIAASLGGGETVSVGDTSVSANRSGVSKAVIDQIVFDYRKDLQRYRRIRW